MNLCCLCVLVKMPLNVTDQDHTFITLKAWRCEYHEFLNWNILLQIPTFCVFSLIVTCSLCCCFMCAVVSVLLMNWMNCHLRAPLSGCFSAHPNLMVRLRTCQNVFFGSWRPAVVNIKESWPCKSVCSCLIVQMCRKQPCRIQISGKCNYVS